jgi:trehalose-6-phosphate synthase
VTIGWSARRLQSTLRRHIDGQQVIVVSNREPCVHELEPDGSVIARHPISGLVTALDPVLRAREARGSRTARARPIAQLSIATIGCASATTMAAIRCGASG